jgi:L-amino acid N-acyltransferase YncA
MDNGSIRTIKKEDSRRICDIYNHYVLNTCISFEEEPVSLEEMQKRIASITAAYPFYVYERDGELLGYAYANRWKERSAYRYVAEVTVYIDKDHLGKGIGRELLKALLDESRKRSFHALMAVISLPNEASVRLHEEFGFKKAAHFTEVGYKQDKWIDVGYWELLLSGPKQK